MILHQAKLNRSKGFALAMVTSFMWAILPIALKTVLKELDPVTTTWYRFSLAAALQITLVLWKKQFPTRFHNRQILMLWAGTILGLVANHTLFVAGLRFLQPVATTIFVQLAPVFLLVSSLVIFKEPFTRRQWLGLFILLSGMILFFTPELKQIGSLSTPFFMGLALVILAAIAWTVYALCQKQLLVHYSSRQIVTLVYIGGTLLLLPWAEPMQLATLNPVRMALVIFAGLNTFIAYGAFSEALDNWDASRVSAVLAMIPVLAVILMVAAQTLFPVFVEPENLTLLKLTGACIVVAGSMLCALSKRAQS